MPEEQVVQTAVGLGQIKFNDEGFVALFDPAAWRSCRRSSSHNPDALREAARFEQSLCKKQSTPTSSRTSRTANGFATIRELIDALLKASKLRVCPLWYLHPGQSRGHRRC
jgi:hypothetical protein